MERKSSVKDIHKYKDQDYSELYKSLCSKLGENNPFAKFNIGAGNYVWSDNRHQWYRMIDASEMKQSIIHESYNLIKADVAGKIGSATAEVLFTTPDSSYIYYNDDNGDVKILITGWGFKKPVRVIPKPNLNPFIQKNPISISFSYDGNRLKNYEFGLRLAKQIKRLNTDSNGLYVFDNLKVGENFIVTDFNCNKDFRFNVIEGLSSYDFDVTRYSTLEISARSNDQPIIEKMVGVMYHDKEYNAVTDGNGQATIQLPLYDGEYVTASMRDKSESAHITENGGKIEFIFEKEKPVKPDIKLVEILISVMKNDEMLSSQPVTISYGGIIFDGITDSNGLFRKQIEEISNEVCIVTTPGYESQSKQLNSNELNKFVFEKTIVTDPPVEVFNPYILVKRENGDIVNNYPISVEYVGTITNHVSNSEGIVALSNMEAGMTMKVTDGMNWDNVTDYIFKKEQKEYIFFIIPNEKAKSKDIKIMFRNLKGNSIVCNNVTFRQEGKPELTVHLDENGNTYFKEGMFDIDIPISASINGWTNIEQYSAIPFSLEKEEYEYLLKFRI